MGNESSKGKDGTNRSSVRKRLTFRKGSSKPNKSVSGSKANSKAIGSFTSFSPESNSGWDFFISHKQANGGPQCMVLQRTLELQLGRKVWLDMTASKLDTENMVSGVQNSKFFVLFVTKGVFERPYCIMEILEAKKLKKPIVVVFETDPRHGGGPIETMLAELDGADSKLSFLKEVEWIKYMPREPFFQATLAAILQACDLEMPKPEVQQLFKEVSFDRRAVPLALSSLFIDGTREWIFDAIRKWDSEARTKTFLLIGLAGVGKSVCASQLCKLGNGELNNTADWTVPKASERVNPIVVAYHFFKHDDPPLSNARNSILSISAQLRQNVPGFREALEEQTADQSEMENWDLFQLFHRIVTDPACACRMHPDYRAIVVIDALDECNDAPQQLAEIVQAEWKERAPDWLAVFATSRPELFPNIANSDVTLLDTEDSRNTDDITSFLKILLKGRVKGGPAVEKQAVKYVSDLTQGLFLYLRFLTDLIGDGNSTRMLSLEELKECPSGLGGIYVKYFGRLRESLGEENYQKLLSPIALSREPMPKVVWMLCFGLKFERGGSSRKDAKVFDGFFDIESSCQNLLYITDGRKNGENSTARFVHKSMVDWLIRDTQAKGESALKSRRKSVRALHLQVEREDSGHDRVATILMEIIKSGPKSGYTDDVRKYAARNVMHHLCAAERLDEAVQLILDYQTLLTRLECDSADNLVRDAERELLESPAMEFSEISDDLQRAIRVIANAIRLGASAIDRDYRELASQLLGRIPTSVENPHLKQLLSAALNSPPIANSTGKSSSNVSDATCWWKPLVPKLQPATSAALLRILNGHGDRVRVVKVSNNQEWLISGSYDGTLRRWSLATGSLEGRPFRRDVASVVETLSLTPDTHSKLVASGYRDNNVVIWESSTGKKVGDPILQTHFTLGVKAVEFLDSKRLVVAGSSTDLVIIDVVKRTTLKMLSGGHTGYVLCLARSPDGKYFASGSTDRSVVLWDTTTDLPIGEPLRGHKGDVKSLCFSPDSTKLVAGAHNTARIWDVETKSLAIAPLTGHSDSVQDVSYSSDGKTICTASQDTTIRLWNAANGTPIGSPLAGHTDKVMSVAFGGSGEFVVSGSFDRTIRIWNAVAVASGEENLLGQDPSVMRPTRGIGGHFYTPFAFSSESLTIATSMFNVITLHSAVTGRMIRELPTMHESRVKALAFSHDGSVLASGGKDHCIRLWTNAGEPLFDGNPLLGHTGSVWALAFSPDGNMLVSGGDDDAVRVWDLKSGTALLDGEPLSGHGHWVTTVAFSSDGKLIASGSDDADPSVRVWDPLTGKETCNTLVGHTAGLSEIAFSPQPGSRTLVSGAKDKTVRVWNAESGACLFVLDGHSDLVFRVGFLPDCKTFWSKSSSENRYWDVETGAASPVRFEKADFANVLPLHSQGQVIKAPGGTGVAYTLDHGVAEYTSIMYLAGGEQELNAVSRKTKKSGKSSRRKSGATDSLSIRACVMQRGQLHFLELVEE